MALSGPPVALAACGVHAAGQCTAKFADPRGCSGDNVEVSTQETTTDGCDDVDVTIGGEERGDSGDGVDASILVRERGDSGDTVDLAVGGFEEQDEGDTLSVEVLPQTGCPVRVRVGPVTFCSPQARAPD